jgi:hypothetical protein
LRGADVNGGWVGKGEVPERARCTSRGQLFTYRQEKCTLAFGVAAAGGTLTTPTQPPLTFAGISD